LISGEYVYCAGCGFVTKYSPGDYLFVKDSKAENYNDNINNITYKSRIITEILDDCLLKVNSDYNFENIIDNNINYYFTKVSITQYEFFNSDNGKIEWFSGNGSLIVKNNKIVIGVNTHFLYQVKVRI